MQKKAVLITSGGKGLRMQTKTPKQFIVINEKPVLFHTITAFIQYESDIKIVVVLPEDLIGQWKELCQKHNFSHKHTIVSGGPTRFHSVKAGLKHIPDNHIVAIHDGVRPMVSKETIQKTFDFARRFGNAIPVVGINESIRKVEGAVNKTEDRNKIKIVQTPQTFISEKIKKAYNQNYRDSFTDDATVLESTGERIFLVDGNSENIKITMPEDILFAKTILKQKSKNK